MICKLIIATIFCLYFVSLASGASIQSKEELSAANNSSVAKSARGLAYYNYAWDYYPYGYYPYQYYNWYSYYNVHFAAASCGIYACPSQCPGTCGVWSNLGACQIGSCPYVGDVCNLGNIGRGVYLHPYAYDANRYVQCDSTPGVFYIRNCPHGLVFDHRFQVCNYPATYYYGK